MFKAQTAPEELAKDIMDVTKGMGRIDENGMFYMDPATRQILKEATKTLPVDFKQMMNGAAEQAKLTDKISKLSNKGIILGNEGEQAIANLMEFDKSKKEYLVTFPDGTKKELSKVSQDMIDGIIKQTKNTVSVILIIFCSINAPLCGNTMGAARTILIAENFYVIAKFS